MDSSPVSTKELLSTGRVFPRHYVENAAYGDPNSTAFFEPNDKTLCGLPWDRLFVQHNGSICQGCLDELRRRGHG